MERRTQERVRLKNKKPHPELFISLPSRTPLRVRLHKTKTVLLRGCGSGKVYVTVVKNCSRKELLPVIQGKILEGSTIHTDGWRAYDGLILNGYDHYRVFHGKNEFARGKSHVNGIESFWSFAKRRLSKFNGIPSHKFSLYLKECEFRFNHRDQNLYTVLLKVFGKF